MSCIDNKLIVGNKLFVLKQTKTKRFYIVYPRLIDSVFFRGDNKKILKLYFIPFKNHSKKLSKKFIDCVIDHNWFCKTVTVTGYEDLINKFLLQPSDNIINAWLELDENKDWKLLRSMLTL